MNPMRQIRKRQRFTKAMKRQTERLRGNGEISVEKHKAVMAGGADFRVMDKALAEMEVADGMWGGIPWEKIGQWIKENWMEIAKLILSLVVMFI